MKNIFSVYEAASGQATSLPKSKIFCIRNVPDPIKHVFTNILRV